MFFYLLAAIRLGSFVSALPAISANATVYVTNTFTDGNGIEKRSTEAVGRELLDKLIYFSEYTAAAYCYSEYAPGRKVSCGKYETCPHVEKSDTKVLSAWVGIGNNSATGFVAADNTKKQIVLSMRGSVSLSNWIADIKYFQTDCSGYTGPGSLCSIGFLGFWEQCRPEALKGIEQGFREHPDYQLVVTGHSLGGAAAVYAAAEFRKKYKNVLLYTYGQPRAGNTAFSRVVTAQGNNFRVTHTSDAVPKLPPENGLGGGEYKHISPEYWISDGVGTKPENIMVLEGLSNNNGNTGTGQMKFNIVAHIQYFQAQMYSCALPIPNFLGYDGNTRNAVAPEHEQEVFDAEFDTINEEINAAIEGNPDIHL